MDTTKPPEVSHPRNGISTGRIIQTTLSVAILLATMLTAFSPNIFSTDLSETIALLLTPKPEGYPVVPTTQRTLRIGIVSGHWGNDSGAVCPNGTTEADVNLRIATHVQQMLVAQVLTVDLLQEFDPRLEGYQAVVLVSIHNDSCEFKNDQATGFKIAASMSSRDQNRANRLTACLRDRYQRATNLPFHAGSITPDMTQYHAFEEIDTGTTAAIIETGFLNLDYRILTEQSELVARGIVDGILCYVNNESIEPTPMPTFMP